MTQEEIDALKIGDLVHNTGSGDSYVVIETHPTPIAIRSIHITNTQEWEKVAPPTPPVIG